MDEAGKPVTKLLQAWSAGDESASQELFPIVYDQLRLLARRHISHERPGHTLSPTALVHEAFLNLVDLDISWHDRAHFFAIAATMMRRILVDHAKRRLRQKRGGGAVVLSVDDAVVVSAEPDPRILLVDDALKRLAQIDGRKAHVFELSFFGGLTLQEMTDAMGGSVSSLHRDLKFAKAWILHEIRTDSPSAVG